MFEHKGKRVFPEKRWGKSSHEAPSIYEGKAKESVVFIKYLNS